MASEGWDPITVFLDDFLITSPTYSSCLATMNRLMTLLHDLGFSINYNKVIGPKQRLMFLGTWVTRSMKADLDWWILFMDSFNGITPIVDNRPSVPVAIDACPLAAGAVFGTEYIHTPWASWPGCENLSINYLEVLALEPAVIK